MAKSFEKKFQNKPLSLYNLDSYLNSEIHGSQAFFITRGINKSKANKNNDLHLPISLVIPLQNKFKVIIESTLKIKTVANKGKVL
jgi:hypothetical protein